MFGSRPVTEGTMQFEGDMRVLEALRDPSSQTILMPLAGIMRGVGAAVRMAVLQECGITFKKVVAVSTGGPPAAYFIAGQAALGASVYSEECTTNRFLSMRERYMNVRYLADIMSGAESDKKLDVEAVHRSPAELYIALTDDETGKGTLVNAKQAPDMIELLRASVSIPGLTDGSVMIGDRSYLDGVGGCPFPVREVIERFDPTDILILANCAKPEKHTESRRTLLHFAARDYPACVQEAFMSHDEVFAQELEYLRAQRHLRFGIVWSDSGIRPFERRPARLLEAARSSRESMHKLLAQRAA